MSSAARQPEDRLDRIERLLQEVLRELARAAGPAPSAELLSKAAARRLLHCDKPTLEAMLRSGRLRGVAAPSGKGLRIPRAELERYQRAGAPPASPAPGPRRTVRARPRGPAAADTAARIRGIPVPRADE